MADKDEMEKAAGEAWEAIRGDNLDAFRTVAEWWDTWYRKVGHKRLGRVLLDHIPPKRRDG